MSFSSDIKQELNKTTYLNNKEIVKQELIGYLLTDNVSINNEKEIKFATESDYNINRYSKLLTNLNKDHKMEMVGKTFVVTIKKKEIDFIKIENNQIYADINSEELEENYLRAIIRGSFLGSGSVNNPNKKYHLEIDLSNAKNLEVVSEILEDLGIHAKKMILENKYAIYLKEGEEISRFLALLEANKAVMKFEDIRIKKEMRGKVNRLVNCESANLNKTINASIEQIEAIHKLQKTGNFRKLDDNLKEIAMLRLENPDMTLIELGKLLNSPIGKSGVNYRLKKIIEIAKEN